MLSEILFIQSMVSELVKDLQRSSLNYPGNGVSAELLKKHNQLCEESITADS